MFKTNEEKNSTKYYINHNLDIIIEESEKIGNLHYYITINFQKDKSIDNIDFELKKITNMINKKIEM